MGNPRFQGEMRSGNNHQDPAYGVGGFLLEIVKVFVLAVVIIVPIRMFLFQPFFVQGASMEPNFHDGEYLLVNEWGYKHTNIGSSTDPLLSVKSFRTLERGDVVVFRYPKNPTVFYVKRIIGLPGESIEQTKDGIVISKSDDTGSFLLNESSYLDADITTQGLKPISLGDDEYFVMGDNRTHSNDSRSWGPVKKNFIIGKVSVRMWPLNRVEDF